MKWIPTPYMKLAMERCAENATYGLFLDPGMRKTSIVLTSLQALLRKQVIRRVLVVAPLRVAQSTWPKEVRKWDHLAGLKLQVLHGDHKEKLLANTDVHFDVINPDGLEWLVRAVPRVYGRLRANWPWDVLVIDESTRFKHSDTLRFKTLCGVGGEDLNRYARRYILTGSPAPNGLLDLWGQVFILDGGNALGKYFTAYRNAFFDKEKYGWKLKGRTAADREKTAEEIYKLLKPLVLRLEAKDYIDLPELTENVIEVELPAKAMKAHKEMEDVLITALDDGTVASAQNAAVAWGKCRQIANGGIFTSPGGAEWRHIHDAKTDVVEELIEELSGTPALVAYEYKHDLERLKKRLDKEYGILLGDEPKGAKPAVPFIGGGVPQRRFKLIEDAWNRGDIPVLLAQPSSVAHGLNLQETHAAVIDAGLTPDLEVDEQFVRRVWRSGQKHNVIRHRLVGKDTVDEIIMKMLRGKDLQQKSLLAALKDHYKGKRAA
jgi:SNF2 family DNA or RNA helicase